MENKVVSKKNHAVAWQTPLESSSVFYYRSLLRTQLQVHFFFETSEKNLCVMTIDRLLPYKAYPKELTPSWLKKTIKKEGNVLKLWNTTFLKEVHFLARIYDIENPFQYVIAASNQVIEFVFEEPKWEVFQGISLQELLYTYVQKRYKQSFSEWK